MRIHVVLVKSFLCNIFDSIELYMVVMKLSNDSITIVTLLISYLWFYCL